MQSHLKDDQTKWWRGVEAITLFYIWRSQLGLAKPQFQPCHSKPGFRLPQQTPQIRQLDNEQLVAFVGPEKRLQICQSRTGPNTKWSVWSREAAGQIRSRNKNGSAFETAVTFFWRRNLLRSHSFYWNIISTSILHAMGCDSRLMSTWFATRPTGSFRSTTSGDTDGHVMRRRGKRFRDQKTTKSG